MPSIIDETSDTPASWKQTISVMSILTAIFIGLEYQTYDGLTHGTGVWILIAQIYESFGFATAMALIPMALVAMWTVAVWQTWTRIKRQRTQSDTR